MALVDRRRRGEGVGLKGKGGGEDIEEKELVEDGHSEGEEVVLGEEVRG